MGKICNTEEKLRGGNLGINFWEVVQFTANLIYLGMLGMSRRCEHTQLPNH